MYVCMYIYIYIYEGGSKPPALDVVQRRFILIRPLLKKPSKHGARARTRKGGRKCAQGAYLMYLYKYKAIFNKSEEAAACGGLRLSLFPGAAPWASVWGLGFRVWV